jgi:hypothetical protein
MVIKSLLGPLMELPLFGMQELVNLYKYLLDRPVKFQQHSSNSEDTFVVLHPLIKLVGCGILVQANVCKFLKVILIKFSILTSMLSVPVLSLHQLIQLAESMMLLHSNVSKFLKVTNHKSLKPFLTHKAQRFSQLVLIIPPKFGTSNQVRSFKH